MFKAIIFGVWLSSAGTDLVTTHTALSRGAHEANPALAAVSPMVRDTLVMSSAGLAAYALTSPFARSHRKLVWTLTAIGASVHVYAALHNSQMGRR